MKRIVVSVMILSFSALAIAAAAVPSVTEYVAQEAFAGEPSEIGHHARWDLVCEALAAPRLTLERAPGHGRICVSKGDVRLVVSRSHAGMNCIGKSIEGVHVIYSPRSDFAGIDTVRYGLDVPEGHVSFEVSIMIKLGRMKSSSVSTAAGDDARPPGPIPECPAQSS